jgi:uncharacterized SAM-binding protein YcdF (DUF218 family)
MVAYGLRLLCALLAGFTLANVVAGLVIPGFDASIWVVDLRWLPRAMAGPLVLAACAPVMANVFWGGRRASLAAAAGAAILCTLALIDAARFWTLLGRGFIHSDMPVPASMLYALIMGGGAVASLRPRAPLKWPSRLTAATAAAGLTALFPVLQMICFGLTDYRRPADAVLVLGARTYADGTVSDALSDRVREACSLYNDGLVSRLILSGGPGDGAIDEPTAMARLAEGLGVPRQAMILDHAGVNTRASITNATAICREGGLSRVLAVSHFYHLPRIKLEACRAGLDLCTVPAPQGQPLRALPWFVARETAAWWVYWARARAA